MYKFYTVYICRYFPRVPNNFLLIMKLTLVLMITGILHLSASTSAQNINLSVKEVSLKKVFKELRLQSGYNFLYNSKMLNETSPVSLSVKNMPFSEVLEACFKNQPVTYVITQNTVIIKKKDVAVNAVHQQITVSGTVKDSKGNPIPGVNVRLKNTTTGTATDVDGKFSLNLPDNSGVLVFSFLGYETQEATVNGSNALNIILKEQSSSLNEVVVTALGVKRSERSLTYSTQQISSEALTQNKTDNFINALDGKVAGLTVSPSASGVGGSAKVILRGSRSANGNNQPLYVIDGIPITNNSNANGQQNSIFGGGQDGGDGISNLNPEDIESISVLEGASAAALYGSQAQNGVILITTKKGKAGKAQIDFSSLFQVDHIAYKPQFQNQYGQTAAGAVDSWGPAISNTTDNLKDFFQNGINRTNAINLSAGSEIAQTYFSYANTYATGVEPGNKLNRNNFNARETGHFLNDKLTVDLNVNYVDQRVNNSPALGLYNNPLTGLYLFPRGSNISPYKSQYQTPNANGTYSQDWLINNTDIQQNPWWIINNEPNVARRNRVLLNGSIKYDITSWFNIQLRGNVDRTSDDFESDLDAGTSTVFNNNGNGHLSLSNQTIEQKYGDLIANITVPLKGDFKLNGLVGGSITDQTTSGLTVAGDLSTPNFFTAGNTIASLAGTTSNTTSNANAILANHSQLQAIFANANLSYKNWAFLTLTGRNDWSSNLSYTPNDSYFYPSAGLSFILTQMFKLPDAISYAKLRGTYAQVGNTVPPYLTNIQNTQNAAGQLQFNTAAAFHTLKPEKTNSFEIGTDMKFINNLITFSFTYYKTNTLNQYFPIAPVVASLVSTGYVNAGNVQNTGIEFTLGADVIKGHAFGWNTSFNGSVNNNKILDVDSKDNINLFYLTGNGNNAYESVIAKGGSYGDIYGYSLKRDAQGRVLLTGSGTATDPYKPESSSAFGLIANPNPKFQLGWNNTFNYKQLSFGFLVDGKFGGQVLSLTQAVMDQYGVSKTTGAARNAGGVAVNGVSTTAYPYQQLMLNHGMKQ